MNDRERIGKRIAEIRKSKGLSQAKLAELDRITAGSIILYDEYRDRTQIWWSCRSRGDRTSGIGKWSGASMRSIWQMGKIEQCQYSSGIPVRISSKFSEAKRVFCLY